MTVLVLLAGAGFGGGVWLVIRGLFGGEPRPARRRRRLALEASPMLAMRLALGCVLGLAIGLVTRWPVPAVFGFAAGVWMPSLGSLWQLGRSEIPRLDALAGLVELIRDLIGTGLSMPEAIARAARVAPPAIRREVLGLVADLEYQVAPAVALRSFADRVANPVCDIVAGGLRMSMEAEAAQLGPVLTALAATAREEATRLRQVESGRVGKRMTVACVSAFIALLVLGILAVDHPAFQAYDSPTGQLVLAVIGAVFAFGFWLMGRLSRADAPARLFSPAATPGLRTW